MKPGHPLLPNLLSDRRWSTFRRSPPRQGLALPGPWSYLRRCADGTGGGVFVLERPREWDGALSAEPPPTRPATKPTPEGGGRLKGTCLRGEL